jgi:hypothetical protein
MTARHNSGCRTENILIMAKAPIPGRVKTRLCPPFTPIQAAELALAALGDTLATVRHTSAARRVLVLDGPAGDWVPPDIEVVRQSGGGLDERIANGLAAVSGPTIVVGMDTPQLTVGHLTVCWDDHDAWFGPALDGGFWALGLRVPDPALVRGVKMSTSSTGAAQLDRLLGADLRVGLLPTLRDIDTAECAAAVAQAAPHTQFAAEHARMTGQECRVG